MTYRITEKYVGCGMCRKICPVACLDRTYTEDAQDRKVYPYLAAPSACIACRYCALECPVEAVTMKAEADMSGDEKKSLDGPFASGV